MAYPLTPRETDALAFIRSRFSPPPSIGEVGNHLGVSRRRAVELLAKLKQKGWITREPGRHRTVATVAAPVAR